MLDLAFQYNIQNLQASILDLSSLRLENLGVLGAFIGSLVACMFLYKAGLYLYGYSIVRREKREKEAKKNTIQELILMKSIQGELEREMEEALLNSALIRNS